MSYNSVIHHEQGGSVLNINSTGSLNVALGGAFNMSGQQNIKSGGSQIIESGGYNIVNSGAKQSVQSGGCIVLNAGGSLILENTSRFTIGTAFVLWGTELPGNTSAPAGTLFLRSAGSVSTLYINRTVNNAGSVWKAASMLG